MTDEGFGDVNFSFGGSDTPGTCTAAVVRGRTLTGTDCTPQAVREASGMELLLSRRGRTRPRLSPSARSRHQHRE
ncbi:hypothetical protein ASJ30_12100 [Janibacter indicus]|uniref:Uncharacterized protein n=1 Tax=Janibacter indicus TaxID=857417 RepID=A0A1L3MIC8_9MICO|nr:hypothetical protein ASJ30_12100 [Janibacter indicus]